MSIRMILVGLVAIAALSVAPARAELLEFTYVGASDGTYSGVTASWIQSSDPTPDSWDGIYTNVLVSDGMTSFGSAFNVVSFVADTPPMPDSCCGGLGINGEIGDFGVQIFNGTTAMPTFSVGTFDLLSEP